MNELAPDEQKVVDDIQKYGWHVLKVNGDDSGPSFCYSIGLHRTFNHPEIVIIGLPNDLGHQIINTIGEDISNGKLFESKKYYSDIIEGYQCFMLDVDKFNYDEYFGYADWYYKGDDFPVIQCIYPSKNSLYPWDWPKDEQVYQPILGIE